MNDLEPRHHNFHLSLAERYPDTEFVTLKTQQEITVNQNNFLSRYCTWKHPLMGLLEMQKLRSLVRGSSKPSIIYFYEGSFSWAILIFFLAVFRVINCPVVINLFPSSDFFSRYNHFPFPNIFKTYIFCAILDLLCRFKIYVTVDNLDSPNVPLPIRSKLREFPLFSSIEKRDTHKVPRRRKHNSILILSRNIDNTFFDTAMSQSCPKCRYFVLGDESDKVNRYRNLETLNSKIPRTEYEHFFSQFDYVCFFYNVRENSSGKILDVCQTSIPICIPKESQYVHRKGMTSTSYFEFSLENFSTISNALCHPKFRKLPVKSHDWGPSTFLPRLLSIPNESNKILLQKKIVNVILLVILSIYFLATRVYFTIQLALKKLI